MSQACRPFTFLSLDTKKEQKKSQGKPDPSGRFALLARSVCFFFKTFLVLLLTVKKSRLCIGLPRLINDVQSISLRVVGFLRSVPRSGRTARKKVEAKK